MNLVTAKRLVALAAPYVPQFQAVNAVEPLQELVSLLAAHGDCPSVASLRRPAPGTADDYLVLAGITVADHTVRVVQNMIKAVLDKYQFDTLVPAGIVAACGHDVGKMKHLYGTRYTWEAHPLTAAKELSRLFRPCEISWYQMAEQAVLRHHLPPLSDFDGVLREADSQARQAEIQDASRGLLSMQPFTTWFDLDLFLQLLREKINVVETDKGAYCPAFMHRGIVYCRVDAALEVAKVVAAAKGAIDPAFWYQDSRKSILIAIADTLRRKSLLGYPVRSGHFCRYFEVAKRTNDKPVEGYYIPIASYAFNPRPYEFENRRDGWLTQIVEVRLAMRSSSSKEGN